LATAPISPALSRDRLLLLAVEAEELADPLVLTLSAFQAWAWLRSVPDRTRSR